MRQRDKEKSADSFSILALDDDLIITSTIQAYFKRSGFNVDTESDPIKAVERIRSGAYDILLLDYLMTPICGDKVVERIREFNMDLYIILLTGHKSVAPPIKTIRELDIQGYYEKSDRFDQLEMLIESSCKSIRQLRIIREYQAELDGAYKLLENSHYEAIRAMRLMVDAKDQYTRGHSDRVAFYSEQIALRLGYSKSYCEKIRIAGIFHDVGKLGISDDILLKESRLLDEEYEVIKTHPGKGAEILSSVSHFKEIIPAVRHHHERYDGGGYPDGLREFDIPEQARIIAVADSFDAMNSSRRYRKKLDMERTIGQLEEGRGTQFDPVIVDAFLELLTKSGILEEAEAIDMVDIF